MSGSRFIIVVADELPPCLFSTAVHQPRPTTRRSLPIIAECAPHATSCVCARPLATRPFSPPPPLSLAVVSFHPSSSRRCPKPQPTEA